MPFKVMYRKMAEAELSRWETYLVDRVQAKGWDGEKLLQGLRRLPRSVPQAHRWFLLKVHFNAPLATTRLAAALVEVTDAQCFFCHAAADAMSHICSCPAVLAAYDSVAAQALLPPLLDGRAILMLQSDWDGAAVAAVLAFFRAVWDVRGVCRRGLGFSDCEELRELILTSVRCPWLTQSCLTKSKKERRADRV